MTSPSAEPAPQPRRFRWGIGAQLLAPVALLLLVMTAMSTWTALASVQRARAQLETQVGHVAETLGRATYPLTGNVLEIARGLSGAEFALDARNATHEAARRWERTLAEADPDALAVVESAAESGLGRPVRLGGSVYLGRSVRLEHGPDAGATLFILYPEARWQDALREAVYPSVLLGGSGGLAAIVIGVSLAHRLSRRIRALERRTRLIAGGDFSTLDLPGRDDELRDLGVSVNTMAQQLARLQEAVQKNERLRLLGQVSGGLAHQLRNGVAGARLAVQLHVREQSTSTPTRRSDTAGLEVALRQLTLVELNLKRFLDLGRPGPLRLERCSLTAILDEATTLLRPRCDHTGIELRWQPTAEPALLTADPVQLSHLFVNLMSNAIEAAGPGGCVELHLRSVERDDCVRLIVTVSDTGPGPPVELIGRLFEPFATGKLDGVGLGLAVAKQVAESHQGTITWHRTADKTVFRVELGLG